MSILWGAWRFKPMDSVTSKPAARATNKSEISRALTCMLTVGIFLIRKQNPTSNRMMADQANQGTHHPHKNKILGSRRYRRAAMMNGLVGSWKFMTGCYIVFSIF